MTVTASSASVRHLTPAAKADGVGDIFFLPERDDRKLPTVACLGWSSAPTVLGPHSKALSRSLVPVKGFVAGWLVRKP